MVAQEEKDVQEALAKVKDFPIMDKMAQSFLKVHAERNLLAQYLEDFEKQHNELYLLMVALMYQLGKQVVVRREHYPALDFREYLLSWEDCPELGGVKVTVRHFSEEGDDQGNN